MEPRRSFKDPCNIAAIRLDRFPARYELRHALVGCGTFKHLFLLLGTEQVDVKEPLHADMSCALLLCKYSQIAVDETCSFLLDQFCTASSPPDISPSHDMHSRSPVCTPRPFVVLVHVPLQIDQRLGCGAGQLAYDSNPAVYRSVQQLGLHHIWRRALRDERSLSQLSDGLVEAETCGRFDRLVESQRGNIGMSLSSAGSRAQTCI